MFHGVWKLIACLTFILFVQAHAVAQDGISYVYDESGRLVAVIDPSGDTVRYVYDAAGNLLSISRQSSTLVSLLEFTPNTGPVGTEVAIYGTGFSATPSQNVVKFNGVTAVVSSATSTKLITKVPSGATTGPITVSPAAGTATSSAPFVVAGPKAPTISGFTPKIGLPGTSVTVSGTNFRTPHLDNFLKLNVSDSLTTSGTTTSLVTSVPANSGSGRIQVTTAYGKAVSTADFFIPPSPYTPADVQTTGRMSVGTSKTVAITSANKVGMIVFDATAGQRVGLQLSDVRFTYAQVKIYSPAASEISTVGVSTVGGFIDTPVLPADGTYTILVDPDNNYTGRLVLTLSNASDVPGSITPGGSPVTVTTTSPGQNGRVTFSGTAGQRVSIRVSGVTVSGTGIALNKPDGSTLAHVNAGTAGGFMDTQTLPVTGIYTILVDPSDVYTGSATLTLYNVPADVNGTLTLGAETTVTTTVPGQNARLSFSATAGQMVSLKLGAVSVPDSTGVTIYRPDGTYFYSTSIYQGGNTFIDTQTLTTAGTYSIAVDPQGFNVGSMTLKLYDVADVKAAITAGGAALTLTTTSPGQLARATFSGTAGQRVSLKVSGVTVSGTYVTLYKPDGAVLASLGVGTGGGFMDTQTLPTAGTYTIVVDPSDLQTGSATLTLYKVPADASVAITPGGAAATVTTTVPGQNARFTFNGTAGQVVSFTLWGGTIPDYTFVTLYGPADAQVASMSVYQGTSGSFGAITLPATGSYRILVDPQGDRTGRMSINNPPVATGTITPGGPALGVNISTPGQNVKLTFNGTTGQRVSLAIFSVTFPYAVVSLKRPDGVTLAQPGISANNSYFIDTLTLPMTGTYTILVDPYDTYTGRATLALYNVVDATGSVTPGGPPVNVTINTPGQRALLTFNASAGQKVFLKLSNVTTSWARVSIIKPAGLLAETSVGTTGGLIETQTIPFSGTYTIVFDPADALTGNATLTLYDAAEVTGTLVPNGPPVNVTTTSPGQNARLTFAGTAGQKVLLALNEVRFPNGVNVRIYQPDGAVLAYLRGESGQSRLHDVPPLPLVGTYTVIVDPPDITTGSLTVALSSASDVSAAIAPGGSPVTVTTTSPGQNGRVTFSGTAGQRVSLRISGVTVSGTNVTLNRPDGINLASVTAGTGGAFMDTQILPVAGTYTILVDPSDVYTGSATLTLYNVPADVQRSLAVGSSATAATSMPGQNMSFTFSATAGQMVALNIGAVSIPDYSQIQLYGPDGSQLASTSVYQGSSTFIDTLALPLTGSYTLVVDPQNGNAGSCTLTLYNSPDVTGSITPGGAAVRVNITIPGQNARLSFAGTAGWQVSINLSLATIPDYTTVTLYGPDGAQLGSALVFQGQTGLINTQTLPLTGTYTIVLDPLKTNTGVLTVQAVKH